MKKRKVKKLPFLILFVLICITFGSLYVFRGYFEKNKDENNPDIMQKDEPKVREYSTTFTLGGNVLVNSNMWYDTMSAESFDFDYIFEDLNDIMKKSNINFYTQQSIVGGIDLGFSLNYNYNSPPEVVTALGKLGFNAMSLASYHSFDKGSVAIENTIKTVTDNKFIYAGVSTSEEERLTNNIIVKNGLKIGLLSYTMGTDTVVPNTFAVDVYSDELAKSDIEKLKKDVDIIMVSIDWSDIKSLEVTEEQKRIATNLSRLGANIVVGNTGYTIQPIEIIDETLVCYSLGNLLSGHYAVDSRISAMVDFNLKVTESGSDKKITFDGINVLLTYAHNVEGKNYKIIPFTKLTNELVNYKSYYEKYKTLLSLPDNSVKFYSIGE